MTNAKVPDTIKTNSYHTPATEDPALSKFLNFMGKDITQHPERLQILDVGLVNQIKTLVDGVEFDLNISLKDDDNTI